jgi:hypothetical protein
MAPAVAFWSTRALISALGCAGLAWIYYAAIAAIPPVTWHGSAVYPSKVVAGQQINVTRQFTVHREVIIDVQRRLVSGDCTSKAGCVQYDLPPSTFLITPGEYNRTLPHEIPENVAPGKYLLQFELHWRNAVGYPYAVRHPPLSIEVVR